jgi:hypothetical protein
MPPLVLDGSAGVSGVDGTASNPAIEGTDSNTGIFYPAADTVAIGTGGTEALRVNSSQNVGIGTTSPAVKLDVAGNAIIQNGVLTIGKDTVYDAFINTPESMYFNVDSDGNSTGNKFVWGTDRTSNTGGTTWMTLDASGNLGIGTTTLNQKLNIYGDGTSYSALINFDRGGVYTAQIGTDGAGAIFGSTSNHLTRFITNNTERARITSGGIFELQSPTANGAYVKSLSTITLASNATINITSGTAGACLILLYNIGDGAGAVFFANYLSTSVKIAGDGAATDTGATFAVYKSASSHVTTIRNRYAISQTYRIAVYSAEANP